MKKRLMFIACLAITGSIYASGGEHDLTHKMMLLMMQLGVIIFAAKIGSMLCEKIKVPGVLGEITAGMIVGPYMLGGLHFPGLENGLFPIAEGILPISPELYGICSLAAIVLLFIVGLETEIELLIKYSIVGGVVGIGGVTVSFLLGNYGTILMSEYIFNQHLTFLSPPALLMGIVSTATSVGISARILSERKKLDSPEGVTILAGAVIDDVLGIILLAVGLGVISSSKESGTVEWGAIGLIAGKAIAIWLGATVIGLFFSQKIGFLLKQFKDRTVIAIMALGMALILAGLFEEAKLAMVIGAYVMGLSLSQTDISRVIMEKLDPIKLLLVPIFFAVMGMLVDPSLFLKSEVLMFGIGFTVIAAVGKLIGCGIPVLFCNFNFRGALRIGVGMLPKGEVTLIVAGIGLANELLSPELFGAILLTVLLTMFIAPPALIATLKNPASGLRKSDNKDLEERIVFSFPNIQTTELLASNVILAFTNEEFYVHSLGNKIREKVYQFRKDEMVIGFRCDGCEIIFECKKDLITFVNTAMIEVVAELEVIMQELKKPIDKKNIAQAMQSQGASSDQKAQFANYITEECLLYDIQGNTKWEIIDELLDKLNSHWKLDDIEDARKAVLSREKSMSTGMQFGLAIPHGKTDVVDKIICVIGVKKQGIDFDSLDKVPSNIFVLALSPASSPAPHMQFMSTMSQALDDATRNNLLNCNSNKEMYNILTEGIKNGKRT